jgi:hypothetical protein
MAVVLNNLDTIFYTHEVKGLTAEKRVYHAPFYIPNLQDVAQGDTAYPNFLAVREPIPEFAHD